MGRGHSPEGRKKTMNLAREHGVNVTAISKIIRRRTWKHVSEEAA